MSISRRGFLQGLAALTVAGSVPAPLFKKWRDDLVIENQHFVLHEPLHIHGKYGVTIRNCFFELADDFVGDVGILLTDCEELSMDQCTIRDPHSRLPHHGACLGIDTPELAEIYSATV